MRRLSAIMFTDMVGYTALMQEDESSATTVRDRHRTVLREGIEAHQGEIVQFYGDGTLSVFPSAVQAVDAAVDIQSHLQLEPPIPVRIGLHIGDIIHDQDGVHGDGVNVAARVQGLAVPGSVLISGGVYQELKNHPRLPTRALGDFELKNVQRPLSIYAVAASELAVPSPADLSSSGNRTKKSIAVLPFVSMSSDPENEYFTDGITEEILNALVKFDDLKVTARTSSFVFKGKHEDVREIGRTLDVGAVLEGSVRKAGNRVRITAQLVDTADGYHLFSNSYDRVLEDIFTVQDEIARTIARELRVLFPVVGARTPTTVRKPTESSEAYSLYLRGLHYWNQWTPNTTQEALGHFRDALTLDPDFALAYTGVARCYTHLGTSGRFTAGPRVFYGSNSHETTGDKTNLYGGRALANYNFGEPEAVNPFLWGEFGVMSHAYKSDSFPEGTSTAAMWGGGAGVGFPLGGVNGSIAGGYTAGLSDNSDTTLFGVYAGVTFALGG